MLQVQKSKIQRENSYTFDGRIRFSEVDHTKKITLPGIVNYFQDCSTFHSEEIGLGMDYFAEHQRAWILSYWQIVVERYPEMGEHVRTMTWAASFKGMLGDRNFVMIDDDGNAVAYAHSIWAYMDMKKGRPVRPDQREIEAYGESEPLEMTYEPRKITRPEHTIELPSMQVRLEQIDTNEHVNNVQYIQMALDALGKEKNISQVRVEYKKSAVYRDIIVPRIAEGGERTIVELGSPEGEVYAIVEFA